MRTPPSAPKSPSAGIVLACASLAFAMMAFLASLWWTASPVLGRLYAGIRIAESAGLWLLTSWGRYFTSTPSGAPYEFTSIFNSSVPFGIAATLVTAAIGFLAYRKRATRHLDVVLAEPASGFTTEAILRDLAPVLPHVAVPTGPAANEGCAGTAARPSPNPFTGLRDLRDTRSVSEAVAHLSWQEAATLALLLDAITPLPDCTRRDALLEIAWKAAKPNRAGRQTLPVVAIIQTTLTLAVSDLGERNLSALEQAHQILAEAETIHEATAGLASLAQSKRTLILPKFAWLRHFDPLLHEMIVAPGQDARIQFTAANAKL